MSAPFLGEPASNFRMEVDVISDGSHISSRAGAGPGNLNGNLAPDAADREARATMGRVLVVSVLAGALAAWMLVGCADTMTFSKDARAQGLKLYSEGNYADAAGAFRSAVRQMPDNYVNYYDLGQSYDQLGQYHESIAAYRSGWDVALASDRGQHDKFYQGKFVGALAAAIARSDTRDSEINWAVDRAHTRGTADDYLLLARVYMYRGDADSAIDSYDHASMLAPDRFDLAKEYGLYLEKMGQNRQAEVPLQRAYALYSGDGEVNAALRRVGVVPGPSLKDQGALAKPLVPRGPIPTVDMSKIIPGTGSPAASAGD